MRALQRSAVFNHLDFAQSDIKERQREQGSGANWLIGHIGEPLDLGRVADRSQRFAGFDAEDLKDLGTQYVIMKEEGISGAEEIRLRSAEFLRYFIE